MEYLKVHDWEEFQIYKDRPIKFIRVFNNLLDNHKYSQLSDAEFGQLVKLWLWAAKTGNEIANDPVWLKNKVGLDTKPNLIKYVQMGFLEAYESVENCTEFYGSVHRLDKNRIEENREEYIHPHLGTFQNIKLTQLEKEKLETKFGEHDAHRRIDVLSEYIASKGKKYSSHYATILTWARKEGWTDGNQSDGGRHDNVFLRTFRENEKRVNGGRMGGRSEPVSGSGDSSSGPQGNGGMPEDADPDGCDPEDDDQ